MAVSIRQIILTPLIMLSFAYIGWQLYEEYSITLAESKLSLNLLSSSSKKLDYALKQQQINLSELEKEIKRINETTFISKIDMDDLMIQELSKFINDAVIPHARS